MSLRTIFGKKCPLNYTLPNFLSKLLIMFLFHTCYLIIGISDDLKPIFERIQLFFVDIEKSRMNTNEVSYILGVSTKDL